MAAVIVKARERCLLLWVQGRQGEGHSEGADGEERFKGQGSAVSLWMDGLCEFAAERSAFSKSAFGMRDLAFFWEL